MLTLMIWEEVAIMTPKPQDTLEPDSLVELLVSPALLNSDFILVLSLFSKNKKKTKFFKKLIKYYY